MYRERNRQRLKAAKHKWYLANKEKINDASKKWAQEHPDRNRESAKRSARTYRKNNRESFYEAVKRWRKKNKQRYAAWTKEYSAKYRPMARSRDPIKASARYILNNAIRAGRIKPPNHCSECKKQCRPDGHHHRGYTDPLKVKWLCRSCHGIAHRKSG